MGMIVRVLAHLRTVRGMTVCQVHAQRVGAVRQREQA